MRGLRRWWDDTAGGLPATFWYLWSGLLINRAGAFALLFLSLYLTAARGAPPSLAGLGGRRVRDRWRGRHAARRRTGRPVGPAGHAARRPPGRRRADGGAGVQHAPGDDRRAGHAGRGGALDAQPGVRGGHRGRGARGAPLPRVQPPVLGVQPRHGGGLAAGRHTRRGQFHRAVPGRRRSHAGGGGGDRAEGAGDTHPASGAHAPGGGGTPSRSAHRAHRPHVPGVRRADVPAGRADHADLDDHAAGDARGRPAPVGVRAGGGARRGAHRGRAAVRAPAHRAVPQVDGAGRLHRV